MVNNEARVGYREIVSRVLSIGYHVSIAILTLGLLLNFIVGGQLAVTVIKVGLLTLLATPLLRVLSSAVVFYFVEKDRKYGLISLVVFLILTISIIIGREI